jgi:endoglucanase
MTDYGAFVKALQAAVTAIRSAGATSQFILLPGNDWTHATEMMNKNGQILIDGVKDTGADQSKLLLDIHQYLDSDGSGTQGSCTTNNVALVSLLPWSST